MTKTKSNRFAKFLCILMVASMLLACAAIFVSADNTDTSYTYSFNTNSRSTLGRYKEDDSCCYMKYETGSIAYTARAHGKTSATDSISYDRSGGFVYRFTSAHEARFMYNYVWEKAHVAGQIAYPICEYISINGSANGTGTATGVWSPDSVNQAGVLPPSDYMQ